MSITPSRTRGAKTQTDPKAQTTTSTYDGLGRLTSRAEPEGTSIWTWDTATYGKGRLAQSVSPEGETKTFTYDSLARPAGTTTDISGGGTFALSQGFDPDGRVNLISG